jgi:hypothetical protein
LHSLPPAVPVLSGLDSAAQADGVVPEYAQTAGESRRCPDGIRPGAPAPCEACGGELRGRWSRGCGEVGGVGFNATDKLVPEQRRQQDYRAVGERAERVSDGD